MSPTVLAAKAEFIERLGEKGPELPLDRLIIENKTVRIKLNIEQGETLTKRSKFLIGRVNDSRLHVKKAFEVEIARQEKLIIANCPTFEISGKGQNASEALDDLGGQLSSLFFSFEERGSDLNQELNHQRHKLREYIERFPGRRQQFWDEFNAAYEQMRNDPGALQQELEERKLWDNTLIDGIE